jgi:hypothetical protein
MLQDKGETLLARAWGLEANQTHLHRKDARAARDTRRGTPVPSIPHAHNRECIHSSPDPLLPSHTRTQARTPLPKLAQQYGISVEAVRRILRSSRRQRPTDKEEGEEGEEELA